MDKQTDKILKTVCFECCNVSFAYSGFLCRGGQHPQRGETVNIDGPCAECPVGVLRGNGVLISKGQPDKIFTRQLVPGKECERFPTVEKLWEPCTCCEHATCCQNENEIRIELTDFDFCVKHCPVKEMRDGIEEAIAEAQMS